MPDFIEFGGTAPLLVVALIAVLALLVSTSSAAIASPTRTRR